MRNAWVVVISSTLLLTAACAAEEVEGSGVGSSNSANMIADGTESSDLGYGWETKIQGRKIGQYSLREIVTDSKVKVRADGRSCLGCHSWAEYQDRLSFCDRVDAFLEMPTLKEGEVDPRKKPANLKKLLKDWKEAGCPN